MARETFKNIITSEEKIKKINPKNTKLVNRYLSNLKKNHSDATIKVYQSNFNIFFVWNLEYNENKFFIDLRKIELNEFFDFCVSDLKYGSARYSNMHSSLSSLSNFIENLLDDEYPDFRNLVKKIDKLPNEKVRKKTVFKEEDVDNFLAKLVKEKRFQEACYIALVISSGARFSELLRFTTDLIDEKHTVIDEIFLETTDEIKTKGRGQNGKMLKKYIIKDIFLPYYKMWLPVREKILKEKEQTHNSIFIKKNGEPATPAVVRNWIKKWENELDENVYIHGFRHYWTTWLSNKNVSPSLIQSLQGWESADMVNLYDDTTFLEKDFELTDLKNSLKK